MIQAELTWNNDESESLMLSFSGDWLLANELPMPSKVLDQCRAAPEIRSISFDAGHLGRWDSALLTFLLSLIDQCTILDVSVNREGLPSGVRRLLALATVVPERKDAHRGTSAEPFLARIGGAAVGIWRSFLELLDFLGETTTAFRLLLTGKARFRRSEFLLIIQECSADALPIVSLISLLVGLILAYVGAIQLRMFGAQIYVADLVGIGMVRAMGAIMTGIIIAGRTGAAFAARIGTMQVNEEIDALRTTGVSPVEFLVLPRILALALMMPLLCLYADLMGIVGGLIVGVLVLDLNILEYYTQTIKAVGLVNVWIGLFSGFVYGILVAVAGCLRGMQCGRSASAVGDATTSAVVTSIVSIVVATAIITVLCDILGI
jgi:phospholipid/cholesterol/gamma-HCH transport system permease protein